MFINVLLRLVKHFGLNPISRKKYLISNLIISFHFLTEWWRTHSNVLAWILSQLFEGGRVPSNMYSRTEPLEISLQVDSEFLVWRGGGYLKKFETIKAVPKIVVVFSYIYKYMLKELEKNILAEGPSPEIKSCSTSMCHMIWQKCQKLYKYGKQANHNDHMNWPSNCLTSLD